METEQIEKLDELFETERPAERLNSDEALDLLGSVIRKNAVSEEVVGDELKVSLQRAYLLAKCIEAWADSERAHVVVPVGLYQQIKKEVEDSGAGQEVIPVSSAMKILGERLSKKQSDVPEPQETKKAGEEPVVWGGDLNSENVEKVDWGEDPPEIRL